MLEEWARSLKKKKKNLTKAETLNKYTLYRLAKAERSHLMLEQLASVQ